jgi:hypothetical protein
MERVGRKARGSGVSPAGELGTGEEVFEAWSEGSLGRWRPLQFPTAEGGVWTWAEPGAEVVLKGGTISLTVPVFTRKHDQVQIFDNPKHLLGCGEAIPVPDEGIVIETNMAATIHNPPSEEWGDGFASFNLMDFEHGLVLDGLANSTRTGALFERLHIPGMIPEEKAWTLIADGPPSTEPGKWHEYRFLYLPPKRRIHVYIDGAEVLQYRGVPDTIKSFVPGVGFITLRPIREGKSQSLRGQGGSASWGAIRVGSP